MEDYMITLDFEDGVSVDCEVLMVFEVDDQDYIALYPTEEAGDIEEGDVFIYRYNEENAEEFEIVNIEDPAELEKVAAVFEELIEEDDEE